MFFILIETLCMRSNLIGWLILPKLGQSCLNGHTCPALVNLARICLRRIWYTRVRVGKPARKWANLLKWSKLLISGRSAHTCGQICQHAQICQPIRFGQIIIQYLTLSWALPTYRNYVQLVQKLHKFDSIDLQNKVEYSLNKFGLNTGRTINPTHFI